MRLRTTILLFLFSTSFTARAEEACEQKLTTYQAVIRCAEAKSPEVQQSLLEVEKAKADVKAAGQWRNPDLSADTLHGKAGGENASETQISLGVPLELGGKVSARTAVAEGGLAKAESELLLAKTTVRTNALLKLHRLRQILHEQEIVEESITTFSKLVSQYAKRFKLSPEQEMSAAVFKMAKSDYELRKAEILEELAGLDSYLKIALGTDAATLNGNLPSSPKSWPKVSPSTQIDGSPRMKLTLAQLQTARAELSRAQSESWPTVVVGPSVKFQSEGGRSDQLYGLNFSLPLPLFNANGAGRASAAAGVKVAEVQVKAAKNEQEKVREELLRNYEQSISALSATLSHKDIEAKHSEFESLFLRGIVPSALVIEAHRTFVDLEKARNAREIKALNALSSIYALDGKLLEIP